MAKILSILSAVSTILKIIMALFGGKKGNKTNEASKISADASREAQKDIREAEATYAASNNAPDDGSVPSLAGMRDDTAKTANTINSNNSQLW